MKAQSLREQNPVDLLSEYFRAKRIAELYGVRVAARPVRFREQAYFTLHLTEDADGLLSIDPIFSGLFSAGRSSQNIHGWVDGDYFDNARFQDGQRISLTQSGFDFVLFKMLGDLVPSGGSFMVSYSLFSKESTIHRDTKRGLDRGYPPAVTPLGFLLFSAGCGMGFKDWYFAEGGREGPEKLQGFKPINSEAAKQKGDDMLQELRVFMGSEAEDDFGRACRSRAEQLIRELEKAPR